METLLIEKDAAGIVTITINRPEKLNALNATVIDELDAALGEIESDSSAKGVILTGAGEKSFVAGADISKFVHLDGESGKSFAEKGQRVFLRLESLSIPVIGAINGYALGGGCELAMACHIRIASENAKFGQPEVNLGIIPGYGGTQRLPRLVGRGIAMELMMTGDIISAQRAYEIGLANHVVAQSELLNECREMMTNIISKAPVAIKNLIKAVESAGMNFDEAQEHEASFFGELCDTEDFKEGVQAFLEKRPSKFKGA